VYWQVCLRSRRKLSVPSVKGRNTRDGKSAAYIGRVIAGEMMIDLWYPDRWIHRTQILDVIDEHAAL
jgi:hypothetical protein